MPVFDALVESLCLRKTKKNLIPILAGGGKGSVPVFDALDESLCFAKIKKAFLSQL